MKKLFIFSLIALLFYPGSIQAKSTRSEALILLNEMIHSLDHIQTFKADVTVVKITQQRSTTANFTLTSQGDQAVAEFSRKPRVVYVQNQKGLYVVTRGKAVKQSDHQGFPFDIPNNFLENLNLQEVSGNAKFLINSKNQDEIIVDMIPIDTGGKSIASSVDEDQTTMLRFSIGKKYHTLNKVEIFKNYQLKTKDYVEFTYDLIDNKVIEKKGIFKNKYLNTQELALTHTKSFSDLGIDSRGNPNIQIKESWYTNITINEKLDEDIFDEEDY